MPEREPFNPLGRVALADSVVQRLIAQAAEPLPPARFLGAGIYAIYYHGHEPMYRTISKGDPAQPIYVGKAVPAGGRIGGFDLTSAVGTALFSRLGEHGQSVAAAGFPPEDFESRHLVVDDIWIPLAEQLMITKYRPLWNRVVSGFGNHHPGRNRTGGARSLWDELHPGRPWATSQPPAMKDVTQIRELIRMHFEGKDVTDQVGEPES